MNEQGSRRQILILALLAAITLIVILIILLAIHSHKGPDYTKRLIDRDTGEVALITPNQQVEKAAGGNSLIIFGASVIYGGGATQFQYDEVKSSLNSYWNKNLGAKYQSLTLIPTSFKKTAGDLRGLLRLGQGNNKVNIEVKLSNLYNVQVKVLDSSGNNGGSFDSGVLPKTVPTDEDIPR
jgi:hypothetical protein